MPVHQTGPSVPINNEFAFRYWREKINFPPWLRSDHISLGSFCTRSMSTPWVSHYIHVFYSWFIRLPRGGLSARHRVLPFGKKLGRLCEFEQYTVNVCETILCEIVDESSCFGYTRTCSSDIADQEACHAAGFFEFSRRGSRALLSARVGASSPSASLGTSQPACVKTDDDYQPGQELGEEGGGWWYSEQGVRLAFRPMDNRSFASFEKKV